MKLTGNKRKGRHLDKNVSNGSADDHITGENGLNGANQKKSKSKKRLILSIVAGVLVILIGAGVYLKFFIRRALDEPPPHRDGPKSETYQNPVPPSRPVVPSASPGGGSSTAVGKAAPERDEEILTYTFLMLALDDGNGNTDVIMAATLDATNHTLNVVSIPRDTLTNVGWDNKRANAIYSNMKYQHGREESALPEVMAATVDKFADILGYKVDYWFLVDLRAFIALVDAVEGVDFDVPVNMNYDDPYQDLSIHYTKGLHHLNGQQASEVVRYRRGYADQDIGRINTQQDFLMTAAGQILEKRDSISTAEFASIILRYVKTDIKLEHLIFFGNELLKLDAEDISFDIIPGNYNDYVGGTNYVTIYIDEWLELVNSKLNPYVDDITPENVSILTRGSNGSLYATDGNRQTNSSFGTASQSPGNTSDSAANTSPANNQTSGSSNNPPNSTGAGQQSGAGSGGDPDAANSGDGHDNTGTGPPGDTDGDNETDPLSANPEDGLPVESGNVPPDDTGDNQSEEQPDDPDSAPGDDHDALESPPVENSPDTNPTEDSNGESAAESKEPPTPPPESSAPADEPIYDE